MNERSDISKSLSNALSTRSAAERGRIVREVADLFLHEPAAYSSAQVDLFDDVLMKLVEQIDVEVKTQLAGQLAESDRAPPTIIRRLANDADIAVARPLLARSPCLDEEFLVESASTRSQDHLLAIASRAAIGHRVTDVLADRGDEKVALALAGNHGAELSPYGYALMIERATDSGRLARVVWNRNDISRRQALALFEKASAVVRRELESAGVKKHEQITVAVQLAARKLQEKTQESSSAYARAHSRIAALQKTGGLAESHVLSFARQGEFEEVVIAIAALSRLPAADTERMLLEETNDRMFIVLKAIGLSWTTLRQILRMNRAAPFPTEQLERWRAKYQAVPREAAAKTLQFHQLRQKARGTTTCET